MRHPTIDDVIDALESRMRMDDRDQRMHFNGFEVRIIRDVLVDIRDEMRANRTPDLYPVSEDEDF